MTGMNFATTAIEATAATLVHLLWQGAVIALALAGVLRLLRNARAEARYAAAVTALALVGVAGGVTMAWQWDAPVVAEEGFAEPIEGSALVALAERAPEAIRAAMRPGRAAWRDAIEGSAPALVALWFAGVLVLSLRLTIGYARVLELVREGDADVGEEWSRAFRRLSRRVETGAVRLLRSARVEVPTVIGWMRPVILVPASALTGLDPRQIETILAHELAHIRRHDYLVNLLQSVLETLLFYHPGVWWISKQVRIEREHCCDDLAIALCGDRILYAKALAELEELRAVASLSVAATGGSLLARIRRIVGAETRGHVHSGWFALVAILMLTAAVAVGAPMTSMADPDGAPGPAGFLIWPAESGVARVAAAIAGATPFATSPPVVETPGPVVVDPREPEPVFVYDFDADDAEAIVRSAHDAAHGAASYAYAYAASGPVLAAMAQQGETVTVRENRVTRELTVDELIRIKNAGVDGAYARRMRDLGYDLPVGQLAAMRAVGVTPEYVEALRAAGYRDLDAEEIQGLRAVGVSPEYIAELRRLGLAPLPADDLMSLRAVGVSPAYIAEMRKLFGDDLDADELASLRAVGVTAAFAAGMQKAGYTKLDADTMIELRAVGVTPDYVTALRAAGFADASLDDITAARAVGVSPAYLHEMAQYGIRDLDLDEVVGLRAVGVTPAWIRDMRQAGFSSLDADEMQQLRALGVTAAWVGELRAAGLRELTPDDLIELRAAGIDAEFIRNLKAAAPRN